MTARDTAERAVTLDASILGRDYKIACKEHERAELAEAVTYLDKQMREIRDHGKVTGADRIAVMAALNIAHDLLRARREGGSGANVDGHRTKAADAAAPAIDATSAQRRIRDMGTAIDQLLAGQEKLF
jgi:cell division protein ZapA